MATQIISFTNLLAQVGARTTNLFELELNSGIGEVDKVVGVTRNHHNDFELLPTDLIVEDWIRLTIIINALLAKLD